MPAVVDAVLQRGEFLTAYTPYQPEMSQGVLQAIFEYQTAICELTGMDVSNASGYDGTTVAADACYVAKHVTGRSKVVVTEATNPQVRQVVKTFAPGFGLEVIEVPHRDGVTDPEELAEAARDAACVIFQQPNFFGNLEAAPELAAAANEAGALSVAHVDPLSLGVLEAPGRYGCALAIGEGQGAGNHQSFGGPHYGFLAAKSEYIRRMPGRIVGETVDAAGERGYVLTLQTREQHIRREKATSNITTNQTLLALGGLVYLSWLGPQGLRELGETCLGLAHHAKTRLQEAGLEPTFSGQATFKEFAVRVGRNAADVVRDARAQGVHPGYPLGRDYPGLDDSVLVAVTEKRTPADIDRLVEVLDVVKLIYEKSQAGRTAYTLPRHELETPELPESLRRAEPPRLPELAEPELVRHFTELSTRNFGIDTGFYPLGSCTMKYNPRVNERLANLPGFRDLHPLQEEEGSQGALELMWLLQEALVEISGLHACSLQPAAGSQGELTGLLLMRAYFTERGENEQRRKIVIPDSAHGTNPASVTMAGYEVTPVKTDARGNIDVEDLRGKVDEHTAGLMITNPSTLGLFDEHVEEIARIFHSVGALMYYDGANLNAVCGISRPGDMGFDIVHINLHKTFSQPHGGGGPGGGPIVVRINLEPFLPVPQVVRDVDVVLPRLRPPEVDREGARVHRAVRRLHPLVRVHPDVGPAAQADVGDRRPERQLHARATARRVRPPVRPAVHARVRRLRAEPEARARCERARRRQAADGLRLPSADGLLPADRSRGVDDRAHGDRAERGARRVLRRDARDRARGRRVARVAEGGAARSARAPARRGARREAGDRPVRLRGPSGPLRRAGRAAAAGSAEGRMIRVWRIPFSTNVERVALALGHKGLEAEWVDVDRNDRTTVIEASGQPLVPVLEDDGKLIADSTAIFEYLEERYPDPPLYPRDEARRAEAVLLIDWFNRVWKKPPNELERSLSVEERVEKRIRAQVEELERSRDRFESLLADRAVHVRRRVRRRRLRLLPVPQVRRDRRSGGHGAVPRDPRRASRARRRLSAARGLDPAGRRAPAGIVRP